MKKLKTVAVVCGAIAAVGVGAPAFADDAPAPLVGSVASDGADGDEAPAEFDDGEIAGYMPETKMEDQPWYQKQQQEAREAENRPEVGSADKNFDDWIK